MLRRESKTFVDTSTRQGQKVVGWLLMLALLLCNEFVLTVLFGRDGQLETSTLWTIRCMNALLLGLALLNFTWHRTRHVVRIDLFFLAMAVGLLVVECYLRIVEIPQDQLEIDGLRLRIPDRQLHHRLESNTVAFVAWGGRKPVIYKTNNLGHRDVDVRHVPRKTTHDTRILILGDSFAECIGVSYEDGFVEVLRRALEKEKVDVEFLNNGIVSYCPRLEKRSLERFLAQGYRSDGVLLFLDVSDIHDQADSGWYGDWQEYSVEDLNAAKAAFELRLASILITKRGAEAYRNFFWPRTLELCRESAGNLCTRINKETKPPYEDLWENERYSWTEGDYWTNGLSWVATGLERCRQDIAAIRDLCDQQEMSFAIVIYPYPVQLMSSQYPSLHQVEFQQFCAQEGILLIDLSYDFKNATRWEDYFMPGDIHWNKRGHRLVAAALLERRAEWLPAGREGGNGQ
jgi:lysophospholipase L1-like esterase